MKYPIKTCVKCGEEFELKPGKPGFANQCPDCSETDTRDPLVKKRMESEEGGANREMNEARREAMKNLLYRKDS